jgi:hypothetical protein
MIQKYIILDVEVAEYHSLLKSVLIFMIFYVFNLETHSSVPTFALC